MKKLTANTKWDKVDDDVFIYCKRPGSSVWEKAFSVNLATIDFIKQNGFQAAIKNSLLAPVTPRNRR